MLKRPKALNPRPMHLVLEAPEMARLAAHAVMREESRTRIVQRAVTEWLDREDARRPVEAVS